MTNIIFSFDTEDIVNEYGADGILRCADILREEGVRGCFNIIGLLPDALLEWERYDVIDALKWHEIDYHSNTHSVHPTINEYTDIEDFDEALRLVIKDEGEGLQKVKKLFGKEKLTAMCVPGNCTSYVAHYGYNELGFDIFSGDDVYDKAHYRPIYFCNSLSLHYARSLDGILFKESEDEIVRFIEETIAEKHTVVFFHHPQRSICKTFWDSDNFRKKNTGKENWIKSEIHKTEDTDRFYRNFRFFVRYLKSKENLNITTYSDFDKMVDRAERRIDITTLTNLRAQLRESFFPVTTPDSYCIADIFTAAKNLLLGKESHTCGAVYGFLYEPYSVEAPTKITKSEAIELARNIKEDYFLPPYFSINGKKIGPADLLDAFFAFLLDGKESYTILPSLPYQIDLDEFPSLRDLSYKGSWVHADTLEDNYLSNRLRLQSWTLRLPKNGKRRIF